MTSKSIKLRKTLEVTSFPPMLLERRHITTFMPNRKEILIHQSMPEVITGIEIISSKPLMHMDTGIMIPRHILGIFKEC
jgi:hypothetical protein